MLKLKGAKKDVLEGFFKKCTMLYINEKEYQEIKGRLGKEKDYFNIEELTNLIQCYNKQA